MLSWKFWRGLDWFMLGSILLLTVLSLAMLYSISLGREGGDMSGFWRQFVAAFGGLIILLGLSQVHSRMWDGLANWLYIFSLAVLSLVLLFGQTINATRGWLSVAGLTIQPVEFAKVMAVIVLAAFLSRRARALDRLPNLFVSFLLVAGLMAPVLLQPDFGSAAIILGLWGLLVLTLGVRREYLIGLVVIALVLGAVSWTFLFKPYQKERLLTFLLPNDQQAAQNYNVEQAIIAVGSGQLMGRGLGAGSQGQLRFLPEASSDFMFATLAEELGFVGVAGVMLLVGVIFFRLWWLLTQCRDWFSSFIVLGTLFLMIIEIIMNAGMNLGLFPVVGIPFPFLSAGGSSLLAHFFLFGIVESIARFEIARGYRGSASSLA